MSLMAVRRMGHACLIATMLGMIASSPLSAADGLLPGEPTSPVGKTREVPRTLLEALGRGVPEGPIPEEVASPPVFLQKSRTPPQQISNPFVAATPAAPAAKSPGAVEFSVTDPSVPAGPPTVRLHQVSPAVSAPAGTDVPSATAIDTTVDAWLGQIKPASHLEASGGSTNVQVLSSENSSGPASKAAGPAESSLQPIPDPQSSGGAVDIEAASFNGVTPGVSSVADVQKAWGPPKEATNRDTLQIQLYAVGPFERVEVSFFQDRVTSIVIRLGKAFPANAVAEQLQLAAIRPVFVSNALGEILGQSFPERGVLFAFEPGEAPGKPSMKVTQIILEPVTAEPFVLRAETDLESHLETSAKDLEAAVKLDPSNSRAHWLQARVLFTLEQLNPALAAATQAVRLEPANPQYRVTRAQLLGQLGQFALAIEEVQRAIETSDKRPHIKAHAVCLLGDLQGSGPQPDYKSAMAQHVEAMKLAEPLVQSPHPAIRVAAKEVLVNAHLGAAHDIAWGNWNQKEVAVPKWLERAILVADDLVDNEGASAEHRFRVAVRALAACVGVQGKLDPTPWAERVIKTADGLILTSATAAQKQRIQWDLGMALYDAVQIYQLRGEYDAALTYGQRAIGYLEKSSAERGSETTDDYLLARLCFRMGAIYAVGKQDHKSAITWFDKAVPAFDRVVDKVGPAEFGRVGETYVSMGVSYWETDRRDEAVTLTQEGIKLIEQMVQKGAMDSKALEVPYSNLATMHRFLGQNAEAETLLQKASQLKNTMLR